LNRRKKQELRERLQRTEGRNSFAELLGLMFIGLKLAGLITWSWWLVLLPLIVGWLGRSIAQTIAEEEE